MHFSKGSVSVWLKTPSLVSKRASLPSMRTCGPFGCRLTSKSSAGRNVSRSTVKTSPIILATVGMSALTTLLICSGVGGRNGLDRMIWLSPFSMEFEKRPKERTAIEMKTLVRGLWLSGVYDQLNAPNLCCLKDIAQRARQRVMAYESGAHGKPNWSSVKWSTTVHSSSYIVPVPMGSFAHKKAKEEVETENLRLCGTKTIPVFEDGEWECLSAPHLFVASLKSKERGKEKKGPRQLAADPGSTGPKWAAEEQHWVPLFNTILEVLRQRLCRRQCQEREVVRCLESLNWLAGRRDLSNTKERNRVPHFSNKRCRREFQKIGV